MVHPGPVGGYLFSSKSTPSILHVPLFSMVVRFQNRFCFLSSPIISGEGKISPPPKSKGSPLRVQNKKNYWIVDCDSSKEFHHPSSIIHHPSPIIHHPSSIIHHLSFIINHQGLPWVQDTVPDHCRHVCSCGFSRLLIGPLGKA